MAEVGSAQSVKTVVPSDSVEVRGRGIYVGVTGNISLVAMEDNTPVVFTAVPAGTVLPVSPRLIRATGTTATGMLLLA
jgi:hypothetical protein